MKLAKVLTVIAGFILVSCSVKEDRMECPGDVIVRYGGGRGLLSDEVLKIYVYDSRGVVDVKDLSDVSLDTVVFRLPKGAYRICGVVTSQQAVIDGQAVRARQGSQIDSVWASMGDVVLNDEYVEHDCIFYKQFSTVTVRNAASAAGGRQFYDCAVTVQSSTSGMNIQNLSGFEGRYSFSPDIDEDGSFRFRMPRQRDESMTLTLSLDGDRRVYDFDLTKKLHEVDYDFNAPDMKDISLSVDFVKLTVTIVIEGWEKEFTQVSQVKKRICQPVLRSAFSLSPG